jgi:hypothetical protein
MSVVGLVDRLVGVDWVSADQAAVVGVLADVRTVRGWLDSIEILAARRLTELAAACPSMFPEHVAAQAGRVTLSEAWKGFHRADTVEAIPELGAVLASGKASGGHVDVLTRALRPLTPEQRARLAERGDTLAQAATLLPCDEYARTVGDEIRRIHNDDGITRLNQQRRATTLRHWVDRHTGMRSLRGDFDPETGALLDAQLRTTIERLFHDSQPDTCPDDPLAKQHHLAALALAALITGTGHKRAAGRIDMSVLIDADTLLHGHHPHTIFDCGTPVDLPVETIRRWACLAEITPIITAADGIKLYLGRDSRLANRDQRRALRAMYRHCAIPGCRVSFDYCAIHHLTWYRHQGKTDIDNLLPICTKHHHLAHEGGWKLHLDTHRNLTITYPDSTTMTTGPPTRRAR